jgi:hypothetical protein
MLQRIRTADPADWGERRTILAHRLLPKRVVMRIAEVIHSIRTTGIIQDPLLVLMSSGVVRLAFRPKSPAETAVNVLRIARSRGRIISLFEVDQRLAPPPPTGTAIGDPPALGWVEYCRILWALPLDGPTFLMLRAAGR